MNQSIKKSINIDHNIMGTYTSVFNNFEEININSEGQKQETIKDLWFEVDELISSFTGREKYIDALHSLLFDNQIVVVSGLGGIGKTELVRKYAWIFRKKFYENTIWFNADTLENLEQCILRLAIDVDIPVKKHGVARLISSIINEIYECCSKNNCLIIFDNSTDLKLIKKYLPSKRFKRNTFSVLITSQNREWGIIKCLSLEVLTEEESILLVNNSLEGCCNTEEEITDIVKLVKILQYLPLALQQAIAYIVDRKTYVSSNFRVKDYIDKFENEPILNYQFDDSPFPDYSDNMYGKTVYITVSIALENIQKCSHSKESFGILFVVAYLAPDDIPKDIFLPLVKGSFEDLDIALRNITKYCIMTEQGDIFKIHRLVQQILRHGFKLLKHYSFLNIALSFVVCEMYKDSAHCTSVLSHAQELELIFQFYETKCNALEKDILLYSLSSNGFLKALHDILNTDMYKNQIIGFGIIFAATRNGHLNVVKYFADYGVSIDVQDELGWSHLHQAAYYGQLEACRFFLNRGVDLNIKTNDGWSPLHLAAQEGHLNVVALFIERKAQTDIRGKDGWTPFLLATRRGHLEVMKLLLSINVVNMHIKSTNGWSSLHLAAFEGHVDVMAFLIERGASVNETSAVGFSPLHLAVISGHIDAIDYLIQQNSQINQSTDDGTTPLHLAAEELNLEVLKILNDNKVGFTYLKSDGLLIHLVTYLANTAVLSFLKQHRSPLYTRTNYGLSPLNWVVGRGHVKMIKNLNKNGGLVPNKEEDGLGPIHSSAHYIHLRNILIGCHLCLNDITIAIHRVAKKSLSKNSVRINDKNGKGLCPLHFAAKVGNLEIVKFLIQRGALINESTEDGVTPLHLASGSGHILIVKHLIKNGAMVNYKMNNGLNAIHIAVQKGQLEIIKYLLAHGASENDYSHNGWTLLNIAVSHGQIEVVTYFIKKNVSVQESSIDGLSPLHVASYEGFFEIVKLLIAAGASVNALNNNGKTPLQMAIASGNQEIAEYLISNGANLNSIGVDHDSPYHCPAELGFIDIENPYG